MLSRKARNFLKFTCWKCKVSPITLFTSLFPHSIPPSPPSPSPSPLSLPPSPSPPLSPPLSPSPSFLYSNTTITHSNTPYRYRIIHSLLSSIPSLSNSHHYAKRMRNMNQFYYYYYLSLSTHIRQPASHRVTQNTHTVTHTTCLHVHVHKIHVHVHTMHVHMYNVHVMYACTNTSICYNECVWHGWEEA